MVAAVASGRRHKAVMGAHCTEQVATRRGKGVMWTCLALSLSPRALVVFEPQSPSCL